MGTIAKDLAAVLWPKTRRRVLGLLLSRPEEEWHLREIVRQVGLAPATVQREVVALAEAGILRRRQQGNQVYYSADETCPIFPELHRLMLKTAGLADVLCEALQPVADRVQVGFVFGSLAEGTATSDSDVDLMIISQVGLQELVPHLRQAQDTLGREINPVTISAQELRDRVAHSDHFVTTVLAGPKIFLIGDEDDLRRLAE